MCSIPVHSVTLLCKCVTHPSPATERGNQLCPRRRTDEELVTFDIHLSASVHIHCSSVAETNFTITILHCSAQKLSLFLRDSVTLQQLLILGPSDVSTDCLLQFCTNFQISERTRVLVTSQNRYKTHADVGDRAMRQAFLADPNFEWSEAAFLHYLRQHTQPSPPPAQPERLTKDRRDHLVPGAADGGVWWWDTLLPLSLAENIECEELFHSGLTHLPLYNSTFLRCRDNNHAGTVTLRSQVTMLLNLVCNSVLGEREGLCCG